VTSLDKKMEGVVAEFIAGNLTGGNLVVLNQRDLARRMASRLRFQTSFSAGRLNQAA
jgi:hypothetical protein